MCQVSKTQLEKMLALLLLVYLGFSGSVLVDTYLQNLPYLGMLIYLFLVCNLITTLLPFLFP